MRGYHKGLLIALACSLLVVAALLRASVGAPGPLTSAEVLAATRAAVRDVVDAAIARGGLPDAEAALSDAVSTRLARMGFGGVSVHLARSNDLNPWGAFSFLVDASGVEAWFDVEGTRDPLLAIRLGLDVAIRADPFPPYSSHREPGVLAACLEHRYYHAAPDGPDLFARLENRTGDPYHFGFEAFLAEGDRLAVDHTFLETGRWGLTPEQRARYGL